MAGDEFHNGYVYIKDGKIVNIPLYFIEYINNAIIGEHFETKDDLIAFVKSLYYKLTGKEMKEGGYAFCPKFVKGEGMSDGIISDVVLKPDGMVDRLAKYIGLE